MRPLQLTLHRSGFFENRSLSTSLGGNNLALFNQFQHAKFQMHSGQTFFRNKLPFKHQIIQFIIIVQDPKRKLFFGYNNDEYKSPIKNIKLYKNLDLMKSYTSIQSLDTDKHMHNIEVTKLPIHTVTFANPTTSLDFKENSGLACTDAHVELEVEFEEDLLNNSNLLVYGINKNGFRFNQNMHGLSFV